MVEVDLGVFLLGGSSVPSGYIGYPVNKTMPEFTLYVQGYCELPKPRKLLSIVNSGKYPLSGSRLFGTP